MASEPMELVGTRLSRYRLLEEIGKGGMGTVYLAEATEPHGEIQAGDHVAMKVVHPHLLATPEALDRFRREASLGLRIRHPHVVRTLEIGEAEGAMPFTLHYLITEYVRGQTLRDLVRELGLVGEELVLHIARQSAEALREIHAADIVHRDVKPENILITDDDVVRLMDLGVARPLWATTKLSRTGQFVGSVLYAAPEQFRCPDKMDGRADLYALGLVLYGLVTGEHPFDHTDIGVVIEHHIRRRPKPPSELNPDLSPFLEAVVLTLLRKDPDDRFADAGELLRVIDEREESAWWRGGAGGLRSGAGVRPTGLKVDRSTPLVGRAHELARLRAAVDRVAEGGTSAIVLRGEAGVGKTRLVDQLLRELGESRSAVRTLVASAHSRAFGGAGGLIREALLSGLTGPEVDLDLDTVLPPSSPRRTTCAAFLGGLPVGEEEGAIPPDQVPGLLNELVGGLSDRSPILVVLEDLHAADDPSLDLLPMLARASRRRPVMLLLTSRLPAAGSPAAEALLRVAEEIRLETITLDGLGVGDTEALLAHVLDAEAGSALAPYVTPAAGGNPRHALEILAELRESRRVVPRENGGFTVVGSLGRIDMPSSVRERLQGRLASLEEEAREILEMLAVVGDGADAAILAKALGREVLAVLRQLGRLERIHGLVRASRGSFSFAHDRVRDVLLEEMPAEMRRQLHEMVAEMLLEEAPGPVPPERALLLARHLVEAERWDRAHEVLPVAVQRLEGERRFGELIELTDRVLDTQAGRPACPGDVTSVLGLARARAFRHVGRTEDERRELERLARSTVGVLRCRVSLELAWSYHRDGDLDRALSAATLAHQEAQGWGDAEVEREALRCLGAVAFAGGRLTEAGEYLGSALTLCVDARDERGEAALLRILGMVRAGFDDLEGARTDLRRALELARKLGDRAGEAACLGNLALIHRDAGEPDQARDDQLAALEIFREIGDLDGEARALGNLALAEEDLGLTEEALLHHGQAARRLESLGDRRGLAVTRTNLGLLLETLGRYEPAAEELRTALAIAHELHDDALGAGALGALGLVARAQGDLGGALEALEAALSIEEDQAAWREASFLQLDLARLLAFAGVPGARECLDTARLQAEAADDPELDLAIDETEVEVILHEGDLEGSVEAFRALPDASPGRPQRETVRLAVIVGVARALTGDEEARNRLEVALVEASELPDPGPAVVARLALALAGRKDPGALQPLQQDASALRLDDQLFAFWLGHLLEREADREESARTMLEAAYYLVHRAQATLPEDEQEGFLAAYPQRDIVAAWETAGMAVQV
jgi:tetratricopeptide (TPR) repeat protein